MKKLSVEQMESICGGASAVSYISCGIGLVGLASAFVGLVTVTGGVGLLWAAAGYSVAPAGALLGCMDLMRGKDEEVFETSTETIMMDE